jgi:F420 biosynthesis protein FbiB-like protein
MMDFPALARGRRSLRRYTDQAIPPALLQELLELAAWAPSAHNRQPWRFAVLSSPAAKIGLARAMNERLRQDLRADGAPADLIEKDVARSYSRLTGAAALVCLCLSMADMDTYPDPRRQTYEWQMAVQSVAMAVQNLLLGAQAAGLGACWMCAPLFCPDTVRTALALPPDWEPQAIITLGYPAETRSKDRHPLEAKILWR